MWQNLLHDEMKKFLHFGPLLENVAEQTRPIKC